MYRQSYSKQEYLQTFPFAVNISLSAIEPWNHQVNESRMLDWSGKQSTNVKVVVTEEAQSDTCYAMAPNME